jgi:hypothetical protein
MSLGAGEEVRFYLNLLKNNWLGPKYDLPKIPGPPGYWGAGEAIDSAAAAVCANAFAWVNSCCS